MYTNTFCLLSQGSVVFPDCGPGSSLPCHLCLHGIRAAVGEHCVFVTICGTLSATSQTSAPGMEHTCSGYQAGRWVPQSPLTKSHPLSLHHCFSLHATGRVSPCRPHSSWVPTAVKVSYVFLVGMLEGGE